MNTKFKPAWAEHEEGLRSKNLKEQDKAAEAFDITRQKEIASSAKAKKWEEDRKKQWAKDKPQFVKERLSAEIDPIEQFKKEARKGGKFNNELQPMPGWYVIQCEEEQQETAGGIILPGSARDLSNTGLIVAEGGVQYDSAEVHHPLLVSAKVLFKKGAGMDIELNWGKCRLMGYSDILGVLT